MRSWNLHEIETPGGSRSPVVLESDEAARTVLIGLDPGQELGDHEVKERAFLLVVGGSVRVEAGGKELRAEQGTLISFEAVEAGPMAAGIVAKVLSNDDARKRVEVLLLEAKETARRLLAEHRHLLEALAASLVERNELVGDEITDVLERATRPATARPPVAIGS